MEQANVEPGFQPTLCTPHLRCKHTSIERYPLPARGLSQPVEAAYRRETDAWSFRAPEKNIPTKNNLLFHLFNWNPFLFYLIKNTKIKKFYFKVCIKKRIAVAGTILYGIVVRVTYLFLNVPFFQFFVRYFLCKVFGVITSIWNAFWIMSDWTSEWVTIDCSLASIVALYFLGSCRPWSRYQN